MLKAFTIEICGLVVEGPLKIQSQWGPMSKQESNKLGKNYFTQYSDLTNATFTTS